MDIYVRGVVLCVYIVSEGDSLCVGRVESGRVYLYMYVHIHIYNIPTYLLIPAGDERAGRVHERLRLLLGLLRLADGPGSRGRGRGAGGGGGGGGAVVC